MTSRDPLKVFYQELERAQQRALLLDYDGTLAPFQIDRGRAIPYTGVRPALEKIRDEDGTRLVLITGRAIDDLLPLLGLDPPPEVWGSHGWERLLADGTYQRAELDPRTVAGLAQAHGMLQSLGIAERCEVKPASIAVHWRGIAEAEAQALHVQASEAWTPLAAETGLVLHDFDGGVELRVPGRDKGVAVRTVLDEMPPGTVAAYLGDDQTDEDAFAAMSGRGLGILVRPERRATAASVWLKPPEELITFLRQWPARTARRRYDG